MNQPSIRVMPKSLAEQIAAGEVVERPASAAKELLENALDAGATHITLELRRGGIEYLRVTDDGKGIPAEEVPTAFLRHATSKLYEEAQLSAISTLGFRGEALAAISAVARVEMLTKPQDALLGCRYIMENGETHEYERTGCPNGTTVIVRDLFAAVPARYKFLKKDSTEAAAIHAMTQRLALSHPEVSFRLIREGKTVLHTPGDGNLLSAIASALGEPPKNLAAVKAADGPLRLSGFVSRPSWCKGSRQGQFFFVNGRWIHSKALIAALENAYQNQKMVGRFPACVLSLEMPYEEVDVNSHPAKTEVRFAEEQRLYRLMYHGVCNALAQTTDAPTLSPGRSDPRTPGLNPLSETLRLASPTAQPWTGKLPPPPVASTKPAFVSSAGFAAPVQRPQANLFVPPVSKPELETDMEVSSMSTSEPKTERSVSPISKPDLWTRPDPTVSSPRQLTLTDENTSSEPKTEPTPAEERPAPHSTPPSPPSSPAPTPVSPPPDPQPVRGEAGVSPAFSHFPSPYIREEGREPWRVVCELFRTYIVVEQGEKAIFIDKHAAHERLGFERLKSRQWRPMSQELLQPQSIAVSPEQKTVLLEQVANLEDFGFLIQDIGLNSVVLRTIPNFLTPEEAPAALEELADRLLTQGSADPGAARDSLLHTMACKAAMKAGQNNTPQELLAVARAVMAGEVKHCPHGRPVMTVMSQKDLEKAFKRII